MFVKFNDELHLVLHCHYLTQPKPVKNTRKRKQVETEKIYVLVDCNSTSGLKNEICVRASECETLEKKSEVPSDVISFIDRRYVHKEPCIFLRISYETNSDEHYDIETIQKMTNEGMIVELRSGDIRHFKYGKIQFDFHDGVKSIEDDDYYYF
jgi:hypothetical protein